MQRNDFYASSDLNLDAEDPFSYDPLESDVVRPVVEEEDASRLDELQAKLANEIDVLLVETDTIWMLEIQGRYHLRSGVVTVFICVMSGNRNLSGG